MESHQNGGTESLEETDRLHPARPRHGQTVGIVAILTFLVSVFGYIREATLAARFGVSATMDAYFGAILIPYTVYLILVVGTLSPVLIPILLQEDINDREKVSETFSVAANFTLLCMSLIVGLSLLTARRWLPWLFPGFNAATMAMLLRLVYIVFPGVIFLAMAGVFTAALNGFHKFALAAFVPAISSIGVIIAALTARGSRAIYIVGFATAIGFLLQFLFLVPAAGALGIRYRAVLSFRHPAIRKTIRLGGPLFIYLIVANASSIVERNLASRISAGAVSAITYATRLFAVPSNFLAAPLAIVSYPVFAREALKDNFGDLSDRILRTLRFIIVIFLPVTLLVILNALPITRTLYQRGQFHGGDSVLISGLLMLYSIGILPNAIAVILLRCFFAIQDTVTPLIAEGANLAIYTLTAFWLSSHFGIRGLALARGFSFFLVAGVFIFVLSKRRGLLRPDAHVGWLFVKTAVATSVMGLVNWVAWHVLQPSFDSFKTPTRLGLLCAVGTLSVAAFLGVARLLKLREVTTVLKTGLSLIGANYARGLAWFGA
ncbi:MAG: murein biosynthesis integral membrane protein MurJ [Terriglobales bacterium]